MGLAGCTEKKKEITNGKTTAAKLPWGAGPSIMIRISALNKQISVPL